MSLVDRFKPASPRSAVFAPVFLALVGLVIGTLPVRADTPAVTVTPGGGVMFLPRALHVDETRPAGGAIIGIRLSPILAFELRGNGTSATGKPGFSDRDIVHGEGNLTWFWNEDQPVAPYLTAGAGGIRTGGKNELAGNGGAGLLFRFTDQLGLRVDGRDVVFRVPGSNDDTWRHDLEAFAGLAFSLGAGRRDTDKDGVPDKLDKCPDTPRGANVDAGGCPLDGDMDGVFDGLDQCPGTPAGATVDAQGCPKDSDGDGVFDGLDKCPGTAAGVRVDATGCPLDADHDGVPDGTDQCPGTAAGCAVDPNGCPLDSDHDGVCDGLDKCPDTPTTARVDATGCPIVVSQKETELLETGMIRLQNVNFETGKAAVLPESYPALDEVGNILLKWPELRIEIGGHTDSRGSTAYNQKLSEARAQAVLDYLKSKFPDLKPEQFTAVGYGESQPIADNKTALGMAKNRRVEFKVLNREVLRRERESPTIVPK